MMLALSLGRNDCLGLAAPGALLLIASLSTTLCLNSFQTCKAVLENCTVPCSEAKSYFRKALSPSLSHVLTVVLSLLTDSLCILPKMEEPDLSGRLPVFTVCTVRKASAMPRLNLSYGNLNYFLISARWTRSLLSSFQRPFKSEEFFITPLLRFAFSLAEQL